MSRAIAFHVLAAIAFAIHWSTIPKASAADSDSDRCTAVRHHCENGEASCGWLTHALKEDGIVCPGDDAPPSPSEVLVGPVSDEEYARRCERALAACRDDNATCASWRNAFNSHGSICPGVNAPPTATRKGPPYPSPSTINPGAITGQASSDVGNSRAGDSLAKLLSECDVAHGYKTFSVEVKCIKNGIRVSQDLSATTVSEEVQLYTLTADNLADEVSRKAISPAAARVELQKAFLEFRDRVNRRNAEVSAKEDAARLLAQQAAEAAQKRENERRSAAQAAEEAQRRAQQDENQRQAHLMELQQIKKQCIAAMWAHASDGAGRFDPSKVNLCNSDPYAHLRPENQPKPSINCLSQSVGGYGYTTCQ
jgi:hypothetical protein